jgi:hypothetical protein
MLHKLSIHNLTRNCIKPFLGIAIGLSCFGIGTKAYAGQEVYNARIIDYECLTQTCTLTLDTDHYVTTNTASCVRRTFAWNRYEKPDIYGLVREAYYTDSLVRLQYSEYNCYDASNEGGEKYMSLIDIGLQ